MTLAENPGALEAYSIRRRNGARYDLASLNPFEGAFERRPEVAKKKEIIEFPPENTAFLVRVRLRRQFSHLLDDCHQQTRGHRTPLRGVL